MTSPPMADPIESSVKGANSTLDPSARVNICPVDSVFRMLFRLSADVGGRTTERFTPSGRLFTVGTVSVFKRTSPGGSTPLNKTVNHATKQSTMIEVPTTGTNQSAWREV